MIPLWSFLVFFGCVVTITAALILVSSALGQKHTGRTTGTPYESGMPVPGEHSHSLDIKYFLFAIFFVILDAESVFIFAWAVAAQQLGITAYIAILVFVIVLLLAIFYLWKIGALDWVHSSRGIKKRHGDF